MLVFSVKQLFYFSKKGDKSMGFYINPPRESKESFLNREGVRATGRVRWSDVPAGFLPVVLLDNGMFTAAGIAYSERELQAFTEPGDPRPKQFYMVRIEKLIPVSDRNFADFAKKQGLV
jgi:hypothetical protein